MVEKHFEALLFELDTDGDFSLIVPMDDRWAAPLPDNIGTFFVFGDTKAMKIDITRWTREESYYDPELRQMIVVTAFGDKENTAAFYPMEIMILLSIDGGILYTKPYSAKKYEEVEPNYTLRSLMRDKKAEEKSMNAMLKNNPQFKNKKGE